MLVFCEDCGKRHSVTEGGDENGCVRFRCDACGFLITATGVPPKERRASAPDASVELTCSHNELDFDTVLGDEEPEKTIFLAARDGRKLELEYKVLADVRGNIAVEQISPYAFKVRLIAAAKMGADLLNVFDGNGLEFFDGVSGALLTLPLVFSRLKPSVLIEPGLVDLGTIEADVLVEGSFLVKNCTAAPLALTVTADPQSFSLTSFFSLTSDTSLILAAGEERKITFSVRSNKESDAEVPFEQLVLVSPSDNNQPARRLRIIATQKPFAGNAVEDWGAIV
ncbi:MAG: hypothetical protein C0613_09765 [Desulfobulbaceae bacterium]|nr:MAG: hypothetical protein C0613_09765 [Desulfobulbaceae bacterium]